MATFIERAISDMRKPGWPANDYRGSYAPNDEPLWGRAPGTMTSAAQLGMGRYPGKRYNGTETDAWTPLNPDAGNVAGSTYGMITADWDNITWWNQVYLGAYSQDAFLDGSNTRLMIWDPSLWVQYFDTNQWERVWSARTFGGNPFDPEFDQANGGWDTAGNLSGSAIDVRMESMGYLSFRLKTGSYGGLTAQQENYWILHGWAGSAPAFRGGPNNVKNVLAMQYNSLVLHSSSGLDDRDASRYLVSVGADHKPTTSTAWWPGVGSAKHRFARAKWPRWEVNICHTMTEAEIRSGTFPPELAALSENTTGTSPAPAPAPSPSPAPAPSPSPAPAGDWPSLATAPTGAYVAVEMTQPGYKTWHVEPRTQTAARRTEITRASDFTVWGGSVNAQLARPHYSRRSIWTADGSKVICEFLNSSDGVESGGCPILDGNTFDYLGRLPAIGNYDFRLHPSDPDLVIYPSTNKHRAYSIANNSSTDFFTFTGYTAVDGTPGLFGDEGCPSRDGRYWIGACLNGSGNYDLVCYDAISQVVEGTIQLPAGWGYNEMHSSPMNWWSMSRKGGYIAIQSLASWTTRDGTAVAQGLNVFSRAGALLRTFTGSGYAWHMDMGVDTAGYEVAVLMGNDGTVGGDTVRALKTWRLDGSYGSTPRIEAPAGLTREAWHTSCPPGVDGWAVVSSFGDTADMAIVAKGTLANNIYAVRLDGSQRVAVIGNVRHPTADSADMTYNFETHACAHPLMTAVAFTSVWSYDTSGSRRASHLYVARAEGGTSSTPAPAPTPAPGPAPATLFPGFAPGSYFPTLSNGYGNYDRVITIPNEAPVISTTSLPGVAPSTAYLQTLVATGRPPFVWSVSTGALPTGLSLNPLTGAIFGTAGSGATTQTFTVTCSNGIEPADTQVLTISVGTIPEITSSLPNPVVGAAYSQTLTASGATPITWAVYDGSLPPGLTLNASTGAITGTPTITGGFPFRISATNSFGFGLRAYSIAVLTTATTSEPSPWTPNLRGR